MVSAVPGQTAREKHLLELSRGGSGPEEASAAHRQETRTTFDDPSVAEAYAGKWIAAYGSTVLAAGDLAELLAKIDDAGFARAHVLIRNLAPADEFLYLQSR